MARGSGTAIQNKLIKGLITEATGLNFPEDAVTDALNVKFDPSGFIERRLGIDIENTATTLAYNDSDGVLKEYIWSAVAMNGQNTFLVLQKGAAIHFYNLSTGGTVSPNLMPVSIDLNNYKAPGAGDIREYPASFSSGQGKLFIAHPNCDPVVVRWNSQSDVFEVAAIKVLIRDFEGLQDDLKVDENPADLSTEHHYNLRNQGWDQEVRVGTVSNELGEGGSLSDWDPPVLDFEELT